MVNRPEPTHGECFEFHSLMDIQPLSTLARGLGSLSASTHSKSKPVESDDAEDSSTSNCSSKSNPSSSGTMSGEADNEEEWSEIEESDHQPPQQEACPFLSENAASCCDVSGIHCTMLTASDWYTTGLSSGNLDSPRAVAINFSPISSARTTPIHPPEPLQDHSQQPITRAESTLEPKKEVVIVMAAVTALHHRGSRCSVQSAALLRSHLASERCMASQTFSTPCTAAAAAASAAVFALANATISTTRRSAECSRSSFYSSNNHPDSSLSASMSHCTSETNSAWHNDQHCSSTTRSLRNHNSYDRQRLSHTHSRPRAALPQKSSSQRHIRAQLMYDHWRQGSSPTSLNHATSSSAVSSNSSTGPHSPQYGTDWKIRSVHTNAPILPHAHSHLQPHNHHHHHHLLHQQPVLSSWPEVSTTENNLSESNEPLPAGVFVTNRDGSAQTQAAASRKVVTLLQGHVRSLELQTPPQQQHHHHHHKQRIVLGQEMSSSGSSNKAVPASNVAGGSPRVHRRASTVSVSAVNTADANAWAGALHAKAGARSSLSDPLSAPPGWIGPLGHERTSQTEGGSSSAATNQYANPGRRYRNLRSSDSSPTGPYLRHLWQDTILAHDDPTRSEATFGSESHYQSEQRYCQHLQPKVKSHGWLSSLLRRAFGGCLGGGGSANFDRQASSRTVSHFSFTPKPQQQRPHTASGSGNAVVSKQRGVVRKQGSLLRNMGSQYTAMLRQQLDTAAYASQGDDSSTTSNSGRMPWLQHVDPTPHYN